MKITKYFVGIGNFNSDTASAIRNLIAEKDQFINDNDDTIGEIDSEDMTMQAGGPNNNALVILIKLVYYPKI